MVLGRARREACSPWRVRVVVAFSLAAFSAAVFCADRHIAFERDQAVWIANLDGTGEKKIADGALPEISPDGTHVAFNTEGDAKNRPGPERHIAVADVASGKVTVLPNIPSDNRFGLVWSPDGNSSHFRSWQARPGNSA